MEGGRGHIPIEEMEFFKQYLEVAHWAWRVVQGWAPFARETTGRQLVRAADSVGANLVEGDARFSHAEAVRFFHIARGSAREARYWIRVAVTRGLVPPEQANGKITQMEAATRQLNAVIRHRRQRIQANKVQEERGTYLTEGDDPFVQHDLDGDPAPTGREEIPPDTSYDFND